MVSKSSFPAVWSAADAAGVAAAKAVVPNPMVVVAAGGGESWHVSEGVCGFAWVTVKPGNHSFANWLKKECGCGKAYGGGVSVWVSAFGQSHTRKCEYARAFAKSLREAFAC